MMAEALSRKRIRQVNLDYRQPDGANDVAKGYRRVRITTRIHHDAVDATVDGILDVIDKHAFVIRLLELKIHIRKRRPKIVLDVFQRRGAVNVGLARPYQIQIGAV